MRMVWAQKVFGIQDERGMLQLIVMVLLILLLILVVGSAYLGW